MNHSFKLFFCLSLGLVFLAGCGQSYNRMHILKPLYTDLSEDLQVYGDSELLLESNGCSIGRGAGASVTAQYGLDIPIDDISQEDESQIFGALESLVVKHGLVGVAGGYHPSEVRDKRHLRRYRVQFDEAEGWVTMTIRKSEISFFKTMVQIDVDLP